MAYRSLLPISALMLATFAFGQKSETPTKTTYLRCGALFDGKSDTARKNVVIAELSGRVQELEKHLQGVEGKPASPESGPTAAEMEELRRRQQNNPAGDFQQRSENAPRMAEGRA